MGPNTHNNYETQNESNHKAGHLKVTRRRLGLTGKWGARVIRTSRSTPVKGGTSLGSGNKKRRASSSKQARVSPTANTNPVLIILTEGYFGGNPLPCVFVLCVNERSGTIRHLEGSAAPVQFWPTHLKTESSQVSKDTRSLYLKEILISRRPPSCNRPHLAIWLILNCINSGGINIIQITDLLPNVF